MKTREISLTDVDQCAKLFVAIFSNPPWNETWSFDTAKRRLSDCAHSPNFFGILMEDSDALHGFAFGNIQYYGMERHYYLLELCIRTDRQREGIGTQIMTSLRDRMKSEGVARIYTLTARDSPAHNFYEKLGYYTSRKMTMMVQKLE